MSKSHRRLIGKIDPVSGKMVPTGKRGPHPKQANIQGGLADAGLPCAKSPKHSIDQREQEFQDLKDENSKLRMQLKIIGSRFDALQDQVSQYRQIIDDALASI